MAYSGLAQQSRALSEGISQRAFSVKDRLEGEVQELTQRLQEVKRALTLIAAHPEIEELLTLLGRRI